MSEGVGTKRSGGKLRVFTDGSASSVDRTGGWAFVLKYGEHYREESGYQGDTTSNAMELTAIYRALLRIKLTKHPISVYSDSAYCVYALNKGVAVWRNNGWMNSQGKPVANKELMVGIAARIAELNSRKAPACHVRIRWVKGHAGVELNERADKLAGSARRRLVMKRTAVTKK